MVVKGMRGRHEGAIEPPGDRLPLHAACIHKIPLFRTEYCAMSFFDSDIVQQESKQIFEDYQALVQLGSRYGKFDRDGKVLYIEQMEAMTDRFKIFMKRFELSDDFSAQVTVEQLRTQLSQFGITPQQMFDQMQATLDRMKSQLDK
jgi:Domain of unknown function (DUF1825)